jgi:hypothetical protein
MMPLTTPSSVPSGLYSSIAMAGPAPRVDFLHAGTRPIRRTDNPNRQRGRALTWDATGRPLSRLGDSPEDAQHAGARERARGARVGGPYS